MGIHSSLIEEHGDSTTCHRKKITMRGTINSAGDRNEYESQCSISFVTSVMFQLKLTFLSLASRCPEKLTIKMMHLDWAKMRSELYKINEHFLVINYGSKKS
jgi:hypothetical protein